MQLDVQYLEAPAGPEIEQNFIQLVPHSENANYK